MKSKVSVKRYLRVIKKLLPCDAAQKKRCLDGMEDSVRMYLQEHPDATIEELYSVFGTPDSIVENYLDTVDTAQISKRLSRRKYIIFGIVITSVLALVLGAVAVSIASDVHDIQNGTVVEVVDELTTSIPSLVPLETH